jgi:HK97 family phage major capsid protein
MPNAIARNSPKKEVPLPPPANRRSPDAVMDQLHTQLANVAEQARLIENTADAENRPMSEEEVKSVQQLHADFERIEAEIDARVRSQRMDERMRQPRERLTNADPVEASADDDAGEGDDEEPAPMKVRARVNASRPRITGGEPAGARRGAGGFRSFGEFAIAAHQTWNGKPDARIMNAPSSYGQEAVGADGGFALPPDFRQNIMKTVMGEESLLGRTDQQTTSSNQLTLPQDAVAPWDDNSGPVVYAVARATGSPAASPT